MEIALWIVSGLLALVYLAAGITKTFSPKEKLADQMPWTTRYSAGMVKFVGIAELLGAIGMILPVLTGIAPILTPIAAFALVLVQILAAVHHVRHNENKSLPINIVLSLVALAAGIGWLVVLAG